MLKASSRGARHFSQDYSSKPHLILMICIADTVYFQEFELSCGRSINSRTGIISYTFNWTLGPPELPYDLSGALQSLTLVFQSISATEDGELGRPTIIDFKSTRNFGTEATTFIQNGRLLPVVVTLERNVSGFFSLGEVMPSFNPKFYQVMVSLGRLLAVK